MEKLWALDQIVGQSCQNVTNQYDLEMPFSDFFDF